MKHITGRYCDCDMCEQGRVLVYDVRSLASRLERYHRAFYSDDDGKLAYLHMANCSVRPADLADELKATARIIEVPISSPKPRARLIRRVRPRRTRPRPCRDGAQPQYSSDSNSFFDELPSPSPAQRLNDIMATESLGGTDSSDSVEWTHSDDEARKSVEPIPVESHEQSRSVTLLVTSDHASA